MTFKKMLDFSITPSLRMGIRLPERRILDQRRLYTSIKLFFVLIVFIGFTQDAPAQTMEQNKARALYYAAEDACASEDYESALIALNEAVSLLGTSNAMISSLRIKTLFALEEYDLAGEALDRFFSYEASDELIREMSQYLIRIEKAKERAAQERLARERDQDAFYEAARLNTEQAYGDYLEQFGANGIHASKAESRRDQLVSERLIREEENAWAEAVQADTQDAYNNYLGRYGEDGLHSNEAKAQLKKIYSEYLPIRAVGPIYPSRALDRGIEGSCVVEFTVTRDGTVRDPRVIESLCTSSLFHRPSINAVLKFKYKPRTINGKAVEVPGVRNEFTYEIAE